MDSYKALVAKALETVPEVFPWDLDGERQGENPPILLDIREPEEFARAHIPGSLHVPRGLLEGACNWNYSETEPVLASSREQDIVVICRSGNRSALAARTLQEMGFTRVRSLKTGIRGWNDADQELVNAEGHPVDADELDAELNAPVPPEKLEPQA